MNKYLFTGICLVIIMGFVAFLLLAFPKGSGAWYNHPLPSAVCGQGEHIGNPHCSPSPSPSASVSPGPTPSPCIIWAGEFPMPCPSESPSPTPTPTPEPTSTPAPQQGLSPAGPPAPIACADIEFAPTITSFKRLSPTSIQVTWSRTDPIQDYQVEYGVEEHSLPWNIRVNATHEVVLANLPANEMIWVRVLGTDGHCLGQPSVTIDP